MFSAAVICIALGVPILVASLNVVEVKTRYDNAGTFSGQSPQQQSQQLAAQGGNGVNLTVTIVIPKNMEPPIYVYYQLNSYFQNHKRYVRSIANKQAAGYFYGAGSSTLNICQPEEYEGRRPNASLPNNGIINPCGLIAWSNFNDSYSLSVDGGGALPVDESNIAWSNDMTTLYGNYEGQNFNDLPQYRGGGALTQNVSKSEHLLVWMKPSAYHTMRKLWGKINVPLAAGTVITLQVANRYNIYDFSGQKWLVLSTQSWVGGKNNVLGIVFIVAGALAFLIGVAFFFGYFMNPRRRKYGDPNCLSWNKRLMQTVAR
jgi:hypothetical protein